MSKSAPRAARRVSVWLPVILGLLAWRPVAPERPVAGGKETAILAGGCFWGVEAVFRHVKGVKSATSGFATPVGPAAGMSDPHAGYAEAVKLVYDPSQITLQKILEIFFTVAHDPTELDRQGPDVGPQYRSAVFVSDSAQATAVRAYLGELKTANIYPRPIVTEVVALQRFKEAEELHQDYVAKHPTEPYVMINDAPKVQDLKKKYPDLYRD
jgi:peptide-methionine (S)-S-oxide reductase